MRRLILSRLIWINAVWHSVFQSFKCIHINFFQGDSLWKKKAKKKKKKKKNNNIKTNPPPKKKKTDDNLAPKDLFFFESWCDSMSTNKPHFHFLYVVLLLKLDKLTFIRPIREVKFCLYLGSLAKLTTWFLVGNYTNYARWLSVHMKDTETRRRSFEFLHNLIKSLR